MQNKRRGTLIYIAIIIFLIIGLISVLKSLTPKALTESYSTIMEYFDNLEVSEYTLDLNSGKLTYKLRNESVERYYYVPYVSLFVSDIYGDFSDGSSYRERYNEKYPDATLKEDYIAVTDNSFLTSFLPYLILVAIMIGFTFFIMRSATGGGKMSQFSKANTRNQPFNGKKVTFNDVAGADEEKEELAEIVDFMKNPKKYVALGARVPKGVLLMGPPGTGKTLLAKAVAGEANVPFFSISGSDFVEMFVGVGASRVRDLFEQAKKHTPSIIFIDEIDAVGRQRGTGLGGGHDEREQTLNQLLVEMDGFSENQGIIIIAATNRRDILDPALLRPGRFDRQIVVNYPDIKGREEILKVHTRNKKLSADVSLATIAKSTAGFTGADLENLVNEAALLAARADRRAIIQEDIEEATIKVVAGPEKKSRVVTEKERRLTAYHESGHAVCTYYCPTQDKVHQVSIIPRGMAGGYTMSLPENDRSFVSKTQMEENIITLLGGRVAEKIFLDDISTGASNDIERATKVAKNMVTRYGFSEKLGPVVYGHDESEVFLGRDYSQGRNYSENIAAEIDAEVRELIETAYEKSKDILEAHKDQVHLLSRYLMKYEKIDGADFEKLMKGEITVEDDSDAPNNSDSPNNNDNGADSEKTENTAVIGTSEKSEQSENREQSVQSETSETVTDSKSGDSNDEKTDNPVSEENKEKSDKSEQSVRPETNEIVAESKSDDSNDEKTDNAVSKEIGEQSDKSEQSIQPETSENVTESKDDNSTNTEA